MTATEYIEQDRVILVDEKNNEIGTAEKLEAHANNWLHRAFSVFIFSGLDKKELLLQRRALHKYHSGGLWTNTCCSHPRPGESVLNAGLRRLREEFGFITPLTDMGWFHYNAHFDNGLAENEIDHVLVGTLSDTCLIRANPEEIDSYRWITISELEQALRSDQAQFTPWLEQALNIAKQG